MPEKNEPNPSPTGLPRIGVFGCGYWGKNHVRNFNEIGALSLICDPSPESSDLAHQLAPDVPLEHNVERALASDQIDAAVFATPAETHHDLAIKAMKAGKHVLVEKPLALNFHEGLNMKKVAEETGRTLMVGHLMEFHPAVIKLNELIQDGELGKINYIYSNRLNFGKVRTEENALWSFAPHDISILLRLVGQLPLEASCTGGSYITPNLADVTVSNLLFRNGLRAHIFVSWLNPHKEHKFVVMGDRKMAVFDDLLDLDKGKLTVYDQRVDLDARQPVLQKGNATPITLEAAEPLRNECLHFIDCIKNGRSPLTDSTSGINVLKVLEICQDSLQMNGRPVRLSQLDSPSS